MLMATGDAQSDERMVLVIGPDCFKICERLSVCSPTQRVPVCE